jgi:hypothetical protein
MNPNQIMLKDGFRTIITLENLPTVKLYEKEVTPAAVSGGGPIDITNMRSLGWRTASPKQLKSFGQVSATCAYATEAFEQIIAQIGVNQRILVTFPDNSEMTFWGWIDSFTPSAHKEGDQPTAAIVFHPSLTDLSGAEKAPAYHATAGSEWARET